MGGFNVPGQIHNHNQTGTAANWGVASSVASILGVIPSEVSRILGEEITDFN